MEFMTVKQLADDQGVTYEAIRRLVSRHSDELKDHIHQKDQTRYLDEWAVDFLKKKRRESPIVVTVQDQGSEIETLQAQVEDLRARLAKAQEELTNIQSARIADQAKIISLQDEVKLQLQAKIEFDSVIESRDRAEEARQAAEEKAETLQAQHETDQQQIEELQKEVSSFERSLFGFYRKKRL